VSETSKRDALDLLDLTREALREKYGAIAPRGEAGDDASARFAAELLNSMVTYRKAADSLRESLARAEEEERTRRAAAEEAEHKLDVAEVKALSRALGSAYGKADRALKECAKALNNAEAIISQLLQRQDVHRAPQILLQSSHGCADAIAAAGSVTMTRAVGRDAIQPATFMQQYAELIHAWPILNPDA